MSTKTDTIRVQCDGIDADEQALNQVIAQQTQKITQLEQKVVELTKALADCEAGDPPQPSPTNRLWAGRVVSGDGSGSDPDNLADYREVGDLVKKLATTGGEVLIVTDGQVFEHAGGSILIESGGPDDAHRVTVRGSDKDGKPKQVEFHGTRRQRDKVGTNPDGTPIFGNARKWEKDPDPEKWTTVWGWVVGNNIFTLGNGANYLTFSHMKLAHCQNPWNVTGNIVAPHFNDIETYGTREGVFNASKTIIRLRAERVKSVGYSKRIWRPEGNSHDWLIQDVEANSCRLSGDEHANYMAMDDTAHDIIVVGFIEGGVYSGIIENHDDHESSAGEYWQGDSFSAERGNYNFTLRNAICRGNTDRGVDTKAANTVLENVTCEDNKIGLGCWEDVTARNCRFINPNKRGGGGGTVPIQITGRSPDSPHPQTKLRLENCQVGYIDQPAGPAYRVETSRDFVFTETNTDYVNCTDTTP